MDRIEKGTSVIAFPSEYVCVDVETTGLSYDFDEIIEVSAAVVKDGQVTEVFSSFVKPERSHVLLSIGEIKSMGFDPNNSLDDTVIENYYRTHLIPQFIIDLTGITNEMLDNAPTPEVVFAQLYDIIRDRTIIGHNINFDINFLYNAFLRFNFKLSNDYIDTLRISRKLYPDQKHHRLCDMVQILGIEYDTQHRAESDVLATIQCYEKMRDRVAKDIGFDSFVASFRRKRSKYDILAGIALAVDEIDETNPLFEKVVVFTGALSKMTRKEALQIVSNLGGIPSDSVTKKTNYLVVGNEEFVSSVKNGKTNKMKKAEEYQKSGIEIVTLPEDTFFEMVDQFLC